jgi:Flp pilus assembly protein TadG
MQRVRRSIRGKRWGAAAVEFAIVAPIFLLFIFAMVEFGRMMMVQQIIVQTARDGARHAIVNGSTVETTRDLVEQQLTDNTVTVERDAITVDPNPATAAAGDQITVTVTIPFGDVTWLPGGSLLNRVDLQASTTMRRETAQ